MEIEEYFAEATSTDRAVLELFGDDDHLRQPTMCWVDWP